MAIRLSGHGGIAQLAEHELCKLGVTGSNPVASTNFRRVENEAKVGDQDFYAGETNSGV